MEQKKKETRNNVWEAVGPSNGVAAAAEEALDLEDLQNVKDEQMDQQAIEEAAGELSLLPVEAVASCIVETDSSSGSQSLSSDDDSSTSETVVQAQGPRVVETVPEGFEYFRHAKSGLLHC